MGATHAHCSGEPAGGTVKSGDTPEAPLDNVGRPALWT